MGALNNGVVERCGRVRGVIHEMWIVDKSEHPEIKDLHVVGGEGLQVRSARKSERQIASNRPEHWHARSLDVNTRRAEMRLGRRASSPRDFVPEGMQLYFLASFLYGAVCRHTHTVGVRCSKIYAPSGIFLSFYVFGVVHAGSVSFSCSCAYRSENEY